MNDEPTLGEPGEGESTAAQQRLLGLLGSLSGSPVELPGDLAPQVVRTARWQRRVRGLAFGVGGFAAAAAGAVAVLIGLRGRELR